MLPTATRPPSPLKRQPPWIPLADAASAHFGTTRLKAQDAWTIDRAGDPIGMKTENRETENRETENRETENRETENRETENRETENRETENRETENRETENRETENRETENRETENRETENRETENRETENRETENRETEKQKSKKKQANRKKEREMPSPPGWAQPAASRERFRLCWTKERAPARAAPGTRRKMTVLEVPHIARKAMGVKSYPIIVKLSIF